MTTQSIHDDRHSMALARFLTVAVLALAGLALHLSPWASGANLALLDAGFGLIRTLEPKPAPDDMVVVAMDDTMASPEADSVGPALSRLPEILLRVAKGSPRAIALQIPLPQTSLDGQLPGFDDALATALAVAQAAAPLVVEMSVGVRGEVIPIHGPILRGLDARALAFSLLARDEDGVVRRLASSLPTPQGPWPTSSGWLCEVLEGNCDSGLIDFSLGSPYRHVLSRRVLETRDEASLARLFRGRIVFVARVNGPAHRVNMPVALAAWESPGRDGPAVLAHAQSVRTWLYGRPVRAVPLPLSILVIAGMALLVLARAPLSAIVVGLVTAGALGVALLGLRAGHFVPMVAPLATVAAALAASFAFAYLPVRKGR